MTGSKLRIQTIEAYTTTDDKSFTDIKEALKHQAYLDCEHMLNNTDKYYYGNLGGIASGSDLHEFLLDNKEAILDIFNMDINYKSLFLAAKAYIDVNPADPDINDETMDAWAEYIDQVGKYYKELQNETT